MRRCRKNMTLVHAAVIVTMACVIAAVVPAVFAHGNNPRNEFAGVNIVGIEFAVPAGVYDLFNVLAPDVMSPATDCAELAITICGEGRVCCYCVQSQNGTQSCFFSCQDGDGVCAPCPECSTTG